MKGAYHKLGIVAKAAENMYAIASSGGKDSTLALYRAQQSGFTVTHLFHVYNADTTQGRFHGYKPDMVEKQARLIGLESIIMPTRSQEFEGDFKIALENIQILIIQLNQIL